MKPVYKKFIHLGESSGVSIVLWENNLQLQRQEKIDAKWSTTKDFSLTPSVLKELLWIIPKSIDSIESSRKKE